MSERLTTLREAGLKPWRSLRTRRQRIEAGTALAAATACVAAAVIQIGPALAETRIQGKPVPADILPAIVVGATSCPTLTGPRLAAQLMAASAFQINATTETGQGLANMDTDEWEEWAPWENAQRNDIHANVLALAHRTCRDIGQARTAGINDDDLWQAAIAINTIGLDAVTQAKGIPEPAREHVDLVTGYANWYAIQPQFSGIEQAPQATPQQATGVRVPDEYVDLVLRAGRICPNVLPPYRVAAQLMALSAFEPNLRGPNGGQGIAQFTDTMWEQYGPLGDATVFEPEAAIPAMGSAMCDLENQLSGLKPADPTTTAYTLALAAYQWGVTAVRAAGGVPREGSVQQLTDTVPRYIESYQADNRLNAKVERPTTSTRPSGSPLPFPGPPGSPSTSGPTSSPATTTGPTWPPGRPTPTGPSQPAGPGTWDPTVRWQLKNALNGRVADVPGDGRIAASGTTVQLWDNVRANDQFWYIANVGDADWVTITSAFNNGAVGIRDRSNANDAELVMLEPAPGDYNQQWRFVDGGNGTYFIINRKTGKALDIWGPDCCADNGAPIIQFDAESFAVDQHWTLTR